jgi:hypothetical protein
MEDLIDFESLEFKDYIYSCPDSFGKERRSSVNLQTEVLGNNVLLMYTLHELTQLYYKDEKLSKLAVIQNNNVQKPEKEISLENCSFFVCIGTATAYNNNLVSTLQTAFKNKNDKSTNININTDDYVTKPPYKFGKDDVSMKKLFLRFYHGVFKTNEIESMTKAFDDEKTIHFTIFGRRATVITKPNRKKIFKYNDILIAEATYHFDNAKTLFLNWISVSHFSLQELNIHDKFDEEIKDPNNNKKITINQVSLRKKFGFGTFMLIIGQLFKSIIATYWCPIICQVHYNSKNGPYNWYIKRYFIQIDDSHQLVHDQFIFRDNFIIHKDKDLVWMMLFQPLICLFNPDTIGRNDDNAFKTLLIRGYYHF